MEGHEKGIRGKNNDIEIYWPDILDQNILYGSAVCTQKLMERIQNSIIMILWMTILWPFTLKVSTIRIFLLYASVFLWSRWELPSQQLCYLEYGCWDTLSNTAFTIVCIGWSWLWKTTVTSMTQRTTQEQCHRSNDTQKQKLRWG